MGHQIFYLNVFCKEWKRDLQPKQIPLNWQAFPALPGPPCSNQSHEVLNSSVQTSSPSRNQGSLGEHFLQSQARGSMWFGGSWDLLGPVLAHQCPLPAVPHVGIILDKTGWVCQGPLSVEGRAYLHPTSRAAAAGSCRVSPWWGSEHCTERGMLCAAATEKKGQWGGRVARGTHWGWCLQFLSSQGGICTAKSCLDPQKRGGIYFSQGLECFEVWREARSPMLHQCPGEIATVTSQKHSKITNQTQMIMNHSLETANGSSAASE